MWLLYIPYAVAIPHVSVLATISEYAFLQHMYSHGENNPSKGLIECSYEMQLRHFALYVV